MAIVSELKLPLCQHQPIIIQLSFTSCHHQPINVQLSFISCQHQPINVQLSFASCYGQLLYSLYLKRPINHCIRVKVALLAVSTNQSSAYIS